MAVTKNTAQQLPKADQYDFLGDNLKVNIARQHRFVVVPAITNRGVKALLEEDNEYWSKHFRKREKAASTATKKAKD
jgi:hypothetical protein